MNDIHKKFQSLPQLDRLLNHDRAKRLLEQHSRPTVVEALRGAIDVLRERIRRGELAGFHEDHIWPIVDGNIEEAVTPSFQRVINGTGIILHTNLGRAPLAQAALGAIHETACRYSNLEWDLGTGGRGSRYDHVEPLLTALTGAEAALAVNNNAAALVLALNTFGQGGDVLVSRGELIEIGGLFRIPDIIARSGARLVEVGSTNKTRIGDYERAITPETRVLLKIHPSNFRITGFTEAASRKQLTALARKHRLLYIEDLGSGALADLEDFGLPREPTVSDAVADGAHVVLFSGDKLLGGPQAGIAVGVRTCIQDMKLNPLARALRIDKLSLAALEATLRLYRAKEPLAAELPLLHMLTTPWEALESRAERLKIELEAIGLHAETMDTAGYSGGGSLPDESIRSKAVRITSQRHSSQDIADAMRAARPPVVGRITGGMFMLDVRAIADDEIEFIVNAARGIVA